MKVMVKAIKRNYINAGIFFFYSHEKSEKVKLVIKDDKNFETMETPRNQDCRILSLKIVQPYSSGFLW